MWARVALTHLAPLDGASVVGREVVLRAEGAPGSCGQAVGRNLLPSTTPPTESFWSPCLLEGVDLVSASEKSDPAPAEASKGCLPEFSMMCVVLCYISRCMRPEGSWQRRAFTNNHIQSQIDLLDPSRAPRSPSPHAARQKKENERQKEKTKRKEKTSTSSRESTPPSLPPRSRLLAAPRPPLALLSGRRALWDLILGRG